MRMSIMTGVNGFFITSDPQVDEIANFSLHPDWWSRGYEYPWVLDFAEADQVVADMGCGWMYRPFKDALAENCLFVYAVDADERLHKQKRAENMAFVTADITKEIFIIDAEELDRVFCISVLEDLNEMIVPVLKEFARVIKDDGLIVLTFDVWHDEGRPIGNYPGMNLDKFWEAVELVGLKPVGDVYEDKTDAVFHFEFNLACYHCVLEKA